MKFKIVILILFFASLTALTTFVTYNIFSLNKNHVEASDNNQVYALIFPDQEYVISKNDIDELGGELTIPTLDNTTPKVTYNSVDGLLESVVSPKDYVIDVKNLRAQLLASSNNNVVIHPKYLLKDRDIPSILEYNFRLNRIHRAPLNISLKDGSELTNFPIDSVLLST